MQSSEIREKFLNYFKSKNHHILESASTVTSDEKGVTNSTLFNTAGVQPIIPFILKGEHPNGERLASAQKCIRTIDIDEVGDNTHCTFFEMLGNWSLGDYFKKEAIEMSFEFLTNTEIGLGLNPSRLYVTVFSGNDDAEKDIETYEIWKEIFEKNNLNPEKRIFFLESNWWAAGDNGPCGPDTEMFYDLTENGLGDINLDEFLKADEKQEVVEIWNNVFMQFEKENGKVIGKLKKFAVDTGAGLERLTTILNNKKSVFDTDLFSEVISILKNKEKYEERKSRIIADHLRSSIILINDGVVPSNTDRGYVLRKILRRMIFLIDKLEINDLELEKMIDIFILNLSNRYESLLKNKENIKKEIQEEGIRFRKSLKDGLREFEKINSTEISGEMAFKLFSSYGMPIELIKELAVEKNQIINIFDFEQELKKHQDLSRTSAEGKFKGGLAGYSEIETKYHTATHLLHQALCDVLGNHVEQKGSNINPERMRFDFTHSEKMSADQIKLVQDIVNQKIQENLPVNKIDLEKEEAVKTGAKHLFNDKYSDIVSIYFIGNDLENAYSKEFCGGPHVKNTNEIGNFEIVKEESISSGVRRIKAVLK
jgi:alanyl-tRNA synthetase